MNIRRNLFRLLPLFLPLVLMAVSTQARQLTLTEKKIKEYVTNQTEEAIQLLEKAVNINSGTMNLEGVREVGKLFAPKFEEIGFTTKWVTLPDSINRAGHLIAERRGKQGKRLLLIGHLDTVFEKDSPFQKFVRQDSLAAGPGTEDMKGGDIIILYALKALHSVGALDNTSIIVVMHGDEEEAGRPTSVSRKDIIEAAKRSDVALAFEGAVGLTTATVARRGISDWKLEVTAKQGHSSGIFKKSAGYGAIYELARILRQFQEELQEEYLTFNPGIVLGGTEVNYDEEYARGTAFGKTNVIARLAVAEGDLRFISQEQKDRLRARMRDIVSRHLDGTNATITFDDGYPSMPPTAGNYAILKVFDKVSRDLGYPSIEALDPGARGAGDISFVAPHVDGLDGLGALGDGGHSPDEYIDLRSLPILTQRAALLIYRLTR